MSNFKKYIELQRLYANALQPTINKDSIPQLPIVVHKKPEQKTDFLKPPPIRRIFKKNKALI